MIYVILLVCAFFQISFTSGVPVLIFGSERNNLRGSLGLISENDFSGTAEKELQGSMIIAFVEKELSNEDLSHCKTESNAPCYPNLMKISPKTYYASVENPIEALRKVAHKKEYVNVNANGRLENDVSYEPGKVVFINFERNDKENVQDGSNSHDSIIAKIYQDMSKKGKVVGLYTGLETNSLVRKVRETTPNKDTEPTKPKIFNVGKKVLIYFTELKKIEGNNKSETINIQSATLSSNSSSTSYGVEFVDDKNGKLTFQINFNMGYWSINNLVWNKETFRISPEITVPEDFSYYCGVPSRYMGEKTVLIWSGLQIQPFQKENANPTFDDPWHCVGFTSAGIWAGLFVTFMLLAILSVGISWLMDINTMDRFDDPKGKTITINSTD